MLLQSLWYWFINKQPESERPQTQLSEIEALEIARAAVDRSDEEKLIFGKFDITGEDVIWCFTTATIGSSLSVKVNDHSGEIIENRRMGIR